MERPYDISASVQLSAVRYLHTMRFLKEIVSFCLHFPQLIDAFQRMKALSQGTFVSSLSRCFVLSLSFFITFAFFGAQNYLGPDRKVRLLIEVEAEGPMLLIPKHAFSPEIVGGVIGRFTVRNKFLYDGDVGTLSCRQKEEKTASAGGVTLPCSYRSPGNLSSLPHNNRFDIDSICLCESLHVWTVCMIQHPYSCVYV